YLGHLHPHLASFFASVPYMPVAMVALGYREADVPHPLAGFGYLVPGREGGDILGVLWNSTIFGEHRAHEGKVLLQAILGGARNPGICKADDEALVLRTRVQLHRALGLEAAPIFQRTCRHPLGLPQYEVGHN